ncbi:MAG: AAA family ATPase [Candidatus Aenigmatarchaeota archaeon]
MPKYVITGGPGTGKSTTIRLLEEMGYQIVHEAAMEVIEYEQRNGGEDLPWKNRKRFQQKVMELQKRMENELDPEKQAFLDRGMPDGLAYYRLDGVETPEEFQKELGKNGYRKIFLLDRLPRYEKDTARTEDKETARKIHSLIEEVYRELGYEIEKVPVLPPEERARYIVERTKR